MATILSTKRLLLNQKALILNAGLALVEYDAIKIEPIPFEVPSHIKNAIFTSQNAVNAIRNKNLEIENCFCVGEKTASLLRDHGYRVKHVCEYASELSQYLILVYGRESFYFFCGNIRSDEIPSRLKEKDIAFEEINVYNTHLNTKRFDREFDAILFYSPSGVRSYFRLNPELGYTLAVCIGTTTATEAGRFCRNIAIANTTTIESVIAKTVKILNNTFHDKK